MFCLCYVCILYLSYIPYIYVISMLYLSYIYVRSMLDPCCIYVSVHLWQLYQPQQQAATRVPCRNKILCFYVSIMYDHVLSGIYVQLQKGNVQSCLMARGPEGTINSQSQHSSTRRTNQQENDRII